MNPQLLLAHYHRIVDAEDAVPRLRRFVLDLAVRGKLVEQDPADEPAAELLKRIEMEKARLVKAGEIRKPKWIPEFKKYPYDLSSSWRWTRMREVTSDRGQAVPDAPFTYIDVTAIDKENGFVRDPKVLQANEAPSRARKIVRQGDVIYSCVRPYLLNVAVVEASFDPAPIASTAFAILNGYGLVLPRYLWIVLRSPFMVEYVEANMRGQAYPAINDSDFSVLPFPLPPLAEQRRIVAKVDELMALCDQLEAARREREATRDHLTSASLTRLAAPETGREEFGAYARFALDALPSLTARPGQIKALRQTILNLAVRGKLVEQNPADEPAAELLGRIAVEKERLSRAKEIRKSKVTVHFDSDVPLYSLPKNWIWCRLDSLVLASDAGWSPRTESHAREGDAWGVLKVSAVSWDYFDPGANKQLLPGTDPRLQTQVHRGDFLISRANTAELVARAVLVLEEPQNLMMSDKIVRLRLGNTCNGRFVWLVNNYADHARQYYAVNASGTSPSMKNVSRATILALPFPLPPLAEQHRIVTKVDELMALCDQLEAGLTTADTTRQRLLESLLHEALTSREEREEAA